MQWIDLDGTALRYELAGAGESVVVLLHEMGGTLESWDHVVPELQRQHRTLRFDMRGFGLSEKIRAPVTIEQLADDACHLLDALGLSAPVALVGCAVGGAVALCFAARHQARTARVVVCSPATGIPPARRPAIQELIAKFEHAGMRAVADSSLANSYPPELREADPERFRNVRARWLGNDPASYAAIYRMLAQLEMSPYLQQISAPVLVIGAELDRVRPPEAVKPVADQIPNATYVTARSAHFMATQTPELLLELLRSFLS